MLTAVAPLSIDMYLPSFPLVERALGVAPGTMEFTLAAFFIGLTLGQLAYGPLSDRFGRKPPLYVGYALFTLASLVCALADNLTLLIIGRFLQGLGGCAGMVVTSAMVRDRMGVRDAARVFSLLILVMGLAPILAPLLGGWLLTFWDWRALFVVLAGFGLICLMAIAMGLPETHDTRQEPPLRLRRVAGNYAYLLRERGFVGYVISAGLARAGMFAYIAGSPFLLIQLYGVAPEHFGWFFGANAFALIAASQLNARLLRRLAPSTLLRRALWLPPLAGLGLLALVFSGQGSLAGFSLGFFVFIGSLGWIGPNGSACALAAHGQLAGTAAALNGALGFLFATLAGSLVGLLHDGTGKPLALVMAFCGIGAWLTHRVMIGPLAQAGGEH
jgi:DHA1 family bicyclomycin/chloramphenicol resistance-like MFS transporter